MVLLAGCLELGVVTDGTSISVGKASNGYLVDAARLPDKGEGFMTREIWLARDNRYGTDELVELITGVARRLAPQMKGTKLVDRRHVVAARRQRSRELGVPSLAPERARRRLPLLHARRARASRSRPTRCTSSTAAAARTTAAASRSTSPRTWLLVKELVAAPEAPVQFIFMYEPIAQLLLDARRADRRAARR